MGVFEFLFKYPANLYRQGTVQLEYGWMAYALAGTLAVLAALTLAQYLSRSLPLRRTDRLILAGLRTAWVATLVLMLFAPVLTVTVAQTLRGDVVLLLDDSQSMRIADAAGMTRGTRLRELFAPGGGELSRALEQRFTVHHVGFGLNAGRIARNSVLTFAAPRSDLADALEHARTRLRGATLGAVVLVSDGGAALSDDLQSELLAYQAAGIAVHTVGIGAPRFSNDVELATVSVPERLFPGDLLRAEVTLRQRGAAGRQLSLQVTEEGVLLHRQAFEVPRTHSFTLPVTVAPLKAPGTHRLSFAVTPDADDQLPANNRLDVPVQLASTPVQVLHFEGEPRFEVKFIRGAVRDDPSLQVASLIRTAENKYYRVGVADAEQLLTGFPEEPAALFG